MKLEDRLGQLATLRIEVEHTKQAMKDLEALVAKTQLEFDQKRVELKYACDNLKTAVQNDAKATVKLLRAEATARLLGVIEAL